MFVLHMKVFLTELQWSVLLLESLVRDCCYSEPQTFFIFKNQGRFQFSVPGTFLTLDS